MCSLIYLGDLAFTFGIRVNYFLNKIIYSHVEIMRDTSKELLAVQRTLMLDVKNFVCF